MDFRCLRDNPNLTVIFDTDDGRHRYIIINRPYDEMSEYISTAVKDAYTLLAK